MKTPRTSQQYAAETLTGQPVFTDGRRPTLTDTGRRLTCLEVDGVKRHEELWSKRLGQPIRLVPTGKAVPFAFL